MEYLKEYPNTLKVHGLKNFNNIYNVRWANVAIFVLNERHEEVGEVVRCADWVYYLTVKEEYRHLGIGSALIEAIEDEAISQNIEKLKLHPDKNKQELIDFYSRMGWIAYNHKGNVIMYKELMPSIF